LKEIAAAMGITIKQYTGYTVFQNKFQSSKALVPGQSPPEKSAIAH